MAIYLYANSIIYDPALDAVPTDIECGCCGQEGDCGVHTLPSPLDDPCTSTNQKWLYDSVDQGTGQYLFTQTGTTGSVTGYVHNTRATERRWRAIVDWDFDPYSNPATSWNSDNCFLMIGSPFPGALNRFEVLYRVDHRKYTNDTTQMRWWLNAPGYLPGPGLLGNPQDTTQQWRIDLAVEDDDTFEVEVFQNDVSIVTHSGSLPAPIVFENLDCMYVRVQSDIQAAPAQGASDRIRVSINDGL